MSHRYGSMNTHAVLMQCISTLLIQQSAIIISSTNCFLSKSQGGQQMLNLVDFYGVSFIVFILAIGEVVAICWIYGKNNCFIFLWCWKWSLIVIWFIGVNRLCRDIEFMINIKTGWYWRICWGILTPVLMITIQIYNFFTYTPLTYKGQSYPGWANCKFSNSIWFCFESVSMSIINHCFLIISALGWTISAIGIAQLPLWAGVAYLRRFFSSNTKSSNPFRPTSNWGPRDPQLFEKYQQFVSSYEEQQRLLPKGNLFVRAKRHIFG